MVAVVAIDGPSGSGKGTISRLLAQELGWHFLDSGSLYRVLALAVIKHKTDPADVSALAMLACSLAIKFIPQAENEPLVYLEGEDVTAQIRTEACGKMASLIAPIPEIRQVLYIKQRAFLQEPGLVADGRDMGTVVFKESKAKIFLTASVEERAHRRYSQLQAQGIDVNLRGILQELEARDARDERRQVAPLKPAVDAKLIDTTNLSIDEVVRQVKDYIKLKYGVTPSFK